MLRKFFFKQKSKNKETVSPEIWSVKQVCEYLGLDSIQDDTKITSEQYLGMRVHLDCFNMYSYSSDKKIRTNLIKAADGILFIKDYLVVERINISVKANYIDALNACSKFLKEVDKIERISFSLN